MLKVGSPHDMQKNMGSFQQKTQKIQEKYKDDPEKMGQELMKVMKSEGGGPLKGCLGMLIQIPVMLWLFWVISTIASKLGAAGRTASLGFSQSFKEQTYSFLEGYASNYLMETADAFQQFFLGWDLLSPGNRTVTIIACSLMYINMKMMNAVRPMTQPSIPGANMPDMSKMMNFMNLFIVIMMGLFVYNTSTGVGLYILTTTVFSIGQFIYQQRALVSAKLQSWKKGGQNIVVDKK